MKEVQAVESTDDQRNLSAQKIKRTADNVAAMATNIAENGRVTCKELASAHGVSNGIIYNILRDYLGLMKKSAKYLPKLLSEEQKQGKVRTHREIVTALCQF
jgi:hypothetical protein